MPAASSAPPPSDRRPKGPSAPRGPADGLPTIRVDGNDVRAVAVATQRARQIAIGRRTGHFRAGR